MKTILIPDIHTNHHWVESFLKDKKYDQVIFMGDYFDHYNDTKESNAETAGWLIESLKKPDRIHLLGNHDIPYMFQGMYPCSGYTADRFSSINSVMTQKDWEKLKAVHVIDPWIVSHAGINRNMSHSIYGFREEYLQKKSEEAFEQARAGIECDFFNAGMSRYGPAQVGGITWADWNVDFMPIDGINQVLVRSDIGLTFAATLRAFLRQDPDIIMVGEIRDTETAEIAIRAALTGHLVLSTLHTNDAPSSINRLIDMNIPAFLVASSARLIMAQRMTRKMCQECKEEITLTDDQLKMLNVPDEWKTNLTGYRAKGCSSCGNTGKSGRTGIFEVMPITPAIEDLILTKGTDQMIRKQAIKEGMMTLQMAAIDKMRQGQLSIDEVFSVTI